VYHNQIEYSHRLAFKHKTRPTPGFIIGLYLHVQILKRESPLVHRVLQTPLKLELLAELQLMFRLQSRICIVTYFILLAFTLSINILYCSRPTVPTA
jgi:hypothetical protein